MWIRRITQIQRVTADYDILMYCTVFMFSIIMDQRTFFCRFLRNFVALLKNKKPNVLTVLALPSIAQNRCRFWLGSCCIQVSIRHIPTQTPVDPSYILVFFTENLGFFRFFPFIFGFFQLVSKQFVSVVSLLYRNSFKESIFEYFSENLGLCRFVSVCYETVLYVSIVSIQVRNTETNRIFQFLVSRNKPKQTQNRSCFGLFRFESKFIFVRFEDTLTMMHPI